MDNNPAVTAPASLQRHRSNGIHAHNDDEDTKIASDPAGNALSISTSKQLSLSSSKNNQGWRRVVRNFSPSWFSVTMGTGIVATILITIPWKAQWIYWLSVVFFVINALLFTLAFIISFLRYTIWPEIWGVMIQDATNSLFLGTIPMGFATIVEMWVFVCVPAWGTWAAYVAWALWMIDSLVAISVTISLAILLMSASHQRALDTITAAQLLPIAATIVAAGTGAETASILPNPQYQLGTIITCYIMWGMATPMAMSVLVMYYQRLVLHKMPPREVIVSAFLPLGPLGFGGYTILYLGRMAREVFPLTDSIDPIAGHIAYVLGFFVALIMWGWGLVWMALALACIYKSRPLPFNMGWWGFTFPLGVYSVSTILIGEELPSIFFRVLGTVFGTAVIVLWVVIACGTARGAWSGELFHAPCLANLKKRQREAVVPPSVGEEEKQLEQTVTRSSRRSLTFRDAPRIEGRTAPDIIEE